MRAGVKERVGSAENRAMNAMSDFGERHGVDWLTYNPLRMRFFHRKARENAPGVVSALLGVAPDARMFADVGAGSGAYAAEVARRQRKVFACEKSPSGRLMARRQGVEAVPFDLTRDVPAQLPAVDLAYSFEVAEHLPPELGDRLVAYMAGLEAPTIVFSAARPGQGGTGHINEQPVEYWRERFERHGYRYDPEATDALHAAFRANGVQAPWFETNTQVLRRP